MDATAITILIIAVGIFAVAIIIINLAKCCCADDTSRPTRGRGHGGFNDDWSNGHSNTVGFGGDDGGNYSGGCDNYGGGGGGYDGGGGGCDSGGGGGDSGGGGCDSGGGGGGGDT